MNFGLKIGLVIGRFLAAIVGFVLLYLLAEFILSRVAVEEKNSVSEPKEVEIYIYSNGVHTDIVMPIRSADIDWSLEVDPKHTRSQRTDMAFVAMGWGDKGFYLETPEWSDLKLSVAFKAAFYLGESAMHTTFYRQMTEGDHCIRLQITRAQYRLLITYIRDSFERTADGKVVLIQASTYGDNDSFYEAKRTYGVFYTCNTWANNALKAAGLKACLWTAFDRGILYQYKNYKD